MALRIGIDLGGTKIEALALDAAGKESFRKRIPAPRGDYASTISAVAGLVREAGEGTVGVGIPGALSTVTGLVKNANSTWLIGKPLQQDLEKAIHYLQLLIEWQYGEIPASNGLGPIAAFVSNGGDPGLLGPCAGIADGDE